MAASAGRAVNSAVNSATTTQAALAAVRSTRILRRPPFRTLLTLTFLMFVDLQDKKTTECAIPPQRTGRLLGHPQP